MADITLALALFSGIIFTGFIAEVFFERTNVPDVLILFLLGILLGPVLGYIPHGGLDSIAPFFTTFALIFILFEGALHIHILEFMQNAASSFGLALINFVVSAALICGIGLAFGFTWQGALLLGCILGGTSSAVVVPIMSRVSAGKDVKLLLSLESAITDVLCIVAVVILLGYISLQNVSVLSALRSLLFFFGVSFLLGMVAGVAFTFLNTYIQRLNRSFLTTIAFLLLVYAAVQFLGGNGAIAALAFGLTLGNIKNIPGLSELVESREGFTLNKPEKFFHAQITFFVKVFFFVYLGSLMSFSTFFPALLAGLITVVLLLGRTIPAWALRAKAKDIKDKAFLESLIPRGLAAAVMVNVALTTPEVAAMPHAEILSLTVLYVLLFTIILSSVLVFFIEKANYPGTTTSLRIAYDAVRRRFFSRA